MSFIQSTMKCKECNREINVVFGIVGSSMIGDGGPEDCPVCHGQLETISQGWNALPDTETRPQNP